MLSFKQFLAFESDRKRLNNRPMSVSLDSSMLSSFLGADTAAPGKLSPIKEHPHWGLMMIPLSFTLWFKILHVSQNITRNSV